MSRTIALIGTITHDFITSDAGETREGLGGILYQAAVWCGLKRKVTLFTNLGRELLPQVQRLTRDWETLDSRNLNPVPGPGNRVHLHYPSHGERQEVLESIVPPQEPAPIVRHAAEMEFLVLSLNSGLDITLWDWRTVSGAAACPIWLDIHSLSLSQNLGYPRSYRPLPEWVEWAEGVDYVQANAAEAACMLGEPGRSLGRAELDLLAGQAFEAGVKALIVTMGREGVWVSTPQKNRLIPTRKAEHVADTTGCGDVLCAGTAARLCGGAGLFAAAAYGAQLATEAVSIEGVEETYRLIRSMATS